MPTKKPAPPKPQPAQEDHGPAIDHIVELLEKNLKWSQIIYAQNKKIKRKLAWMSAASYIKVLLILVPLILAFIYLPPLISGAMDQYQSLLFGGGDGQPGIDITSMISNLSQEQVQELLNQFGQ